MGHLQKSAESNSHHAIAGAASGFITRFLCQPLDVVKIRFQVSLKNCKYTSAIFKILQLTNYFPVAVAS